MKTLKHTRNKILKEPNFNIRSKMIAENVKHLKLGRVQQKKYIEAYSAIICRSIYMFNNKNKTYFTILDRYEK